MQFKLRTYVGSFQPSGSNSFNVLGNVNDPDGDSLRLTSARKKTDKYPITISSQSNGTITVNPIFTFGGGPVTDDTPTNNSRILGSKWKNFFARDQYPALKDPKSGEPNREQTAAKVLIQDRYATYGPEEIEYTVTDGKESVTCCVRLTISAEFILSPLAIDLDGDSQITRIDRETLFDMDGDGTKETLTQWFGASDAILIRVPQADEAFSGEHLFGDQGGQYFDGFQKLARLDANADGQVNGAELNGLALWQDKNTNAQLDLGEIISLEQAQISSLGTQHDNYIGSATNTDGAHIHFEDVWFNSPIK